MSKMLGFLFWGFIGHWILGIGYSVYIYLTIFLTVLHSLLLSLFCIYYYAILFLLRKKRCKGEFAQSLEHRHDPPTKSELADAPH